MQDESFPKSPESDPAETRFLKSSSIAELKQQWRALYNSEPPHRISRELLTRAVAYRIQEQVYGGLKPSTRQTADSSRQRRAIRTAAETCAGRSSAGGNCLDA